MADIDPINLELMLSELQSQLPNMQKSGNIYSRFKDKERELYMLREKYYECSKALIESRDKAERLQNMMFKKEVENKQKNEEEFRITNRSSPPTGQTRKVPTQKKSTLEEDGAAPCLGLHRFEGFPSKAPGKHLASEDVESDGDALVSSYNPQSLKTVSTRKCEPVTSPLTIPASRAAADGKCDVHQETKGSEKCDVPLKKLVSEDLLQKVMQQNMRLKKGIREIIETRGLTVDDYLERQDYVEVIKQLKLEIVGLKSQVGELETYANSSDRDLLQRCSQLAGKVHSLEHAATVRQAVIDVYSTELNRLRKQNQTISRGNVSTEGSTPTTISTADTNLFMRKVLEDLVRLKTKSTEMEALYHSKSKVADQLQARVKELEELNKFELTSSGRVACSREAAFSLPCAGLVTDSESAGDPPPPHSVSETPSSTFVCRRCDKCCADQDSLRKHQIKCDND